MGKAKKESQGWEKVAGWYDKLTGKEGHYYQKEIIIPKVLRYLKEKKAKKILDLACGQGVLERSLSKEIDYVGVDISPTLIQSADKLKISKRHRFLAQDVLDSAFSLEEADFDACTIILALQDVKEVSRFLKNASKHLKKGATLVVVMNHPCFRIPRQSSWQVSEEKKMQSRTIQAYLSPLDIPISVNPGQKDASKQVIYHHLPLSAYSRFLFEAGFCIEKIEEWASDKVSVGSKAKMENRARKEFPLFLCLVCKKLE